MKSKRVKKGGLANHLTELLVRRFLLELGALKKHPRWREQKSVERTFKGDISVIVISFGDWQVGSNETGSKASN